MKIQERYGTVLRCYDDGGKCADRYTILPPRWAKERRADPVFGFDAIGCDARPFLPQGIGYHCTCNAGPHLGRRVKWSELPSDVQKFARAEFPHYAPQA